MSTLIDCRKYCTATWASLLAAGLLFNLCGKAHAAPIQNDSSFSAAELEKLWVDLEGAELEASRALLKLASQTKQAVTFLKVKMKPLKITAEQVDDLVGKLGSDKEEVWKPAFEELEYLDPRLAIDLQTLMAKVTESPARQRMVAVMSGKSHDWPPVSGKKVELRSLRNGEGFNFRANGAWWAEHRVALINTHSWGNWKKKWTRATRAIVLLEHFGTPDATAILKIMAGGHEEAGPTAAAKEAIKRHADKASAAPMQPDLTASDKEMEKRWAQLEGVELEATRALLKFASAPDLSTAFLKGRLRPLKITPQRVDELIARLGSPKDDVWKPAFEELEYLDPRLAIDLQTLMTNVTESPARQRMVALLMGKIADSFVGKKVELIPVGEAFNFMVDGNGAFIADHQVATINSRPWGNLKKKWTRATRAIVLLEMIGTPDALAILKKMADGHEKAGPTVAAKEAIERIAKKLP
jgi:hypothetical protein